MSLSHEAAKGLWYWSSSNNKWFVEIYHPFFISKKGYLFLSALTGLQLQNTPHRKSFEFLIFGFGLGVSHELHI